MINIRGIDHVVLRVKHLDTMQRFYCDVLGAQFIAHRPKFGLTHLRAGNSVIDLVSMEGPGRERGDAPEGNGPRNMDHLCLRVEPFDLDAIVAHLKKHGLQVSEARPRYGAEGNGISIYLTDPEGNTVELKGPSDGQPPPPPQNP